MNDDDLIRRGNVLALMQHAVDAYGYRMRGAADKKEKRDWQSMLFAAVDIQSTIAAIPAISIQPMIDKAVAKVMAERDAAVEALRSCPPTSNPNISSQEKLDRIDAWWRLEIRPVLAELDGK